MMGYTEQDVEFMIDSIIKVHNNLPAHDLLEKEDSMAKGGLRVTKEFLEGLLAEGRV